MKEFNVICPYDQSVVGRVADMTCEDLDQLIAFAVEGAEKSLNLSAFRRGEILNEAADLISKRADEFATLITRESGKATKYSTAEVSRAVQTFRFAADAARQIKGETIPLDACPGSENRMGFYQPFPIGVVAAITPFNFPLNLVAHKVAPAIAAGNSVVLKPSPRAPLTSALLLEVLTDAGLPGKIVNLVTGISPELGMGLVKSDDVNLVSFTGSLKVGKEIKAGSGVKKVLLELGSNSACIVEPDVDMDLAVKKCVAGAFAFGGQVCISLQRVYVHRSVHDEFLDKLVSSTEKIKTGDPMDPETEYGPLISQEESQRCLAWVDDEYKAGHEF